MLQFATQQEFHKASTERKNSNYNVDFTELPKDVLRHYKNVFDGWWNSELHTPEHFTKWINSNVQFVDSQAEQYRLQSFSKLIEYVQGKYQFHLDFECKKPEGSCESNDLYERIIGLLSEAFVKWKRANGIIVPKNYNNYFIDSRLELVPVDFGEVPAGVLIPLLNTFDKDESLRTAEHYKNWLEELQNTLQLLPNDLHMVTLKKAIQYGNGNYELHLKECDNIESCSFNDTWKTKIVLANRLLESMQQSSETATQPEIKSNPEFTLSRQVLAIHYLLEYAKIPNVDKAVKARFVQFLTGRETGAKEIKNTNIYKKVDKPLGTADKTLLADLQFVQQQFQNLGLSELSKMIDNEISTIKV